MDNNVLTNFTLDNYDPHVEYNKNFIPKLHQIIPKYYILSNITNTLILHYSLGSGKTATAVFVALQFLKNNMNISFISQFLKDSKSFKQICVVGGWQTKAQFENELIRPEFQLVNSQQIDEINRLVNSEDKILHAEGAKKLEKLKKNLNVYVKYYGYQTFFKEILKFSNQKASQNYDLLIEEWKNHRLFINQEFIDNFSNSIIIIDEMQRLYSSEGLNTYGLAAAFLNDLSKKYNIKVIYLTGTMFNMTISEIESIACLINPELKITADFSKFMDVTIVDDVISKTIRPEHENYYIDLFRPHFAYYDQNRINMKETDKPVILKIPAKQPQYTENLLTPINMDVEELENNVYIPSFLKEMVNNKLKCICLPHAPRLPHVIFVGNCIINELDAIQPFITFTLTLSGLQNDLYNAAVTNTKLELDMVTEEEKQTTDELDEEDSIRRVDTSKYRKVQEEKENKNNSLLDLMQIGLPGSSKYKQFGIIKQSNGIYNSPNFYGEKLKDFSIIAYTVIKMAFDFAKHDEKTVIHSSKINEFGIEQYCWLFEINGAIPYGEEPRKESICKVCNKKLGDHYEESHAFKGIYFAKLVGDQSSKERSNILNLAYNIPGNVCGDIISIIIISDVAYTGVSLFNTQNILLITPISNISKWRQIYCRIVRTNSHDMLPFNKQYAKVYTFAVRGTEETKLESCAINKLYKIKCKLNEDIEHFTRKLSEVCINKYITTEDFQKTLDNSIISNINNMFNNDMNDELLLLFKRIFNNNNATIWSKEMLLQKLRDVNNSVSFINFNNVSDDLIINTLLVNKIMEITDSGLYALTNEYIQLNNISPQLLNYKRKNINYNTVIDSTDIKLMKDRSTKEQKYIEDFKQIKQFRFKYIKFVEIITKIFVNKWNKLTNVTEFWDYVYENNDEYYENDETNFIVNHSTEKRSRDKVAGLYYNNIIILKNGETKAVICNFIEPPTNKLMKLFRITSLKNTISSKFTLHLIILDQSNESKSEVDDRRYNIVGVNCDSYDVNKILKDITTIPRNVSKRKICNSIIPYICDYQLANPNEKYVSTPFEAV